MKIMVFTGNRAEYGLLYHLMKTIQSDDDLTLSLLVSGAHVSNQFGNKIEKIKRDGFSINETVDMNLSDNSGVGVITSMGHALPLMAKAIKRQSPDLLVILGDRYEALCISQAALILNLPIAHIHGGEISEGAYDDAIRHAITKMSYLHFTSSIEHERRVIQLGESPSRVFNVGAVGLENIQKTQVMTLHELSDELNFKIHGPFILFCYHPVTIIQQAVDDSMNVILSSLDEFKDHQIIMTYPNSDNGSNEIIKSLKEYQLQDSKRIFLIESLGQQRYVNALRLADVIVGNSSSGIIEAPFVKTPSVNIGVRQKGRLCSESVIHVDLSHSKIIKAISCAIGLKSTPDSSKFNSPYGNDLNISEKIIGVIKDTTFNIMKKFYDLPEVNYDPNNR